MRPAASSCPATTILGTEPVSTPQPPKYVLHNRERAMATRFRRASSSPGGDTLSAIARPIGIRKSTRTNPEGTRKANPRPTTCRAMMIRRGSKPVRRRINAAMRSPRPDLVSATLKHMPENTSQIVCRVNGLKLSWKLSRPRAGNSNRIASELYSIATGCVVQATAANRARHMARWFRGSNPSSGETNAPNSSPPATTVGSQRLNLFITESSGQLGDRRRWRSGWSDSIAGANGSCRRRQRLVHRCHRAAAPWTTGFCLANCVHPLAEFPVLASD